MAASPTPSIKTSAFDFELPPELIAQQPTEAGRDQSRLLVYQRSDDSIQHRSFPDHLERLNPEDLLVLNNTKVIPARLRGEKQGTGGKMELLLVEETGPDQWLVMLKPGKRVREGTIIELHDHTGQTAGVRVEVRGKTEEGHYHVAFLGKAPILDEVERLGEMPLPPYIQRPDKPTSEDRQRYQTVYAATPGSVAAPTAGLHYTPDILERIRAKGIRIAWVTLHVGLGTFAPVQAEWIQDHQMHEERYSVPQATMEALRQTRLEGGRITAVGTTSLRVLESVGRTWTPRDPVDPIQARTGIFIYPPCAFQLTDRLITNFHLPKSSLLMLVSAFASPGHTDGIDRIQKVYEEAVRERYRFFSYGDAMIID